MVASGSSTIASTCSRSSFGAISMMSNSACLAVPNGSGMMTRQISVSTSGSIYGV